MKLFAWSILLLLVGVITVVASDFRIEYSAGGTREIKVTEQGQLYFTWITGRRPFKDDPGYGAKTQSMESFDSHSVTIWLTKAELDQLRAWIEDNQILGFRSKYPEREPPRLSDRYRSSLTVVLRQRKLSLTWGVNTMLPDALGEAAGRLLEMCERIRNSRPVDYWEYLGTHKTRNP